MARLLFLLAIIGSLPALVLSAPEGLDAKFKAKGKKYFGTCADQRLLQHARNAEVIRADFGQLTPENSMKWDSTEPRRGQFSLRGGDFLVNWALGNNMTVRGHTALWHSQLPQWVKEIRDPQTLANVVAVHVTTLVRSWAGRIYAWDVVNEILGEDGSLRKSVFSDVLGETFVRIAFDAAREADPTAKLYINDYNIDLASHRKTQAMARKVQQWRAQGIPIDGIGSQGHIQPGQGNQVEAGLRLLCSAAPECALTEVDVKHGGADDYRNTVKACLAIENCVGVTVWGVSDRDSWHKNDRPLIFDDNHKPKPAYNAIQQLLS